MRPERIYVYWITCPGGPWRAYYNGLNCYIYFTRAGYIIRPFFAGMRDKPYPSLNLAKRAGSKWLREQR